MFIKTKTNLFGTEVKGFKCTICGCIVFKDTPPDDCKRCEEREAAVKAFKAEYEMEEA